ncbi:endolytic transglycosylase MltG [Hyphomicrobium denitrificans]|uniref:endolytic transglycosylase MltG n=1 Tax=Hyphomicrobium denitrificans TaxID=53399 RepID=UPI00022E4C6C|nr:endolytic transglycosylase MltG [Hyphomicrobium denitrificans]
MFSTIARVISGVLTVSLIFMLLVGGISFTIYNQYESPGPLDAPRVVVIPKGEGRIAIAERLEKDGIISNRWTFVGGHLLQNFFGRKKNGELKAGEYEIKEHASIRDVIETLSEGKSILYKATLPEGLTSEQIVERLKAEPSLSGEVTRVPPEGSLLPDTYYFSKGTPRQEILDRMQAEMEKAISTLWESRDPELPIKSSAELVTFASIVEKETGRADERDRVAAVFYNRLKKGMRLQSDPTIVYGIVGGQGALGRGITKSDIETKSPYNTYQINGLPPGPICNPGKSALQAALHPAKTSDLYFVADGTGGHAFSETLKEHNTAVQKWREVEKQKTKQADDADAAKQDDSSAPIPQAKSDAASKDQARKGKAVQQARKNAKAAQNQAPPGGAGSGDGSATDAAASDQAAGTATETADIPPPVRKPKKQ